MFGSNEKVQEVAQELTNGLIEWLKTNPKNWSKPWVAAEAYEIPHNPISKTVYKGSNVMVLSLTKMVKGFSTGRWATYKQWNTANCQIVKGSKGTRIVKWNFKKACAEASPCKGLFDDKKDVVCRAGHKMRKVSFANTWVVFNADQVEAEDGFSIPEHDQFPLEDIEDLREITDAEKMEEIRAAFKTIKADWREERGSGAYFSPTHDHIVTPLPEQFKIPSEYGAVLGHEFGHWSGSEKRLNRDLSGRFGDASYAFEELIAELCGVFTCNVLGVEHQPLENHAKYLNNWIQALEGEDGPALLWKAGTDAQKAANYLLDQMSLESDLSEPIAA